MKTAISIIRSLCVFRALRVEQNKLNDINDPHKNLMRRIRKHDVRSSKSNEME